VQNTLDPNVLAVKLEQFKKEGLSEIEGYSSDGSNSDVCIFPFAQQGSHSDNSNTENQNRLSRWAWEQ